MDHSSSEHQSQLRLEAMEQELKRVRTTSLKLSTKVSHLRLLLFFQLTFFVTLFFFLLLKGFIDLPQNHHSDQITPILHTDTVYISKEPIKDTLVDIIYNTHHAALPKNNYDGVLFAIQIGAYKDLDLSEFENNMLGLKQDTYNNINQFTLGEFINYDDARQFLTIIRNMGFEHAYIMSFKNGRRIHIQQALALQEEEKIANIESHQEVLKNDEESQNILIH